VFFVGRPSTCHCQCAIVREGAADDSAIGAHIAERRRDGAVGRDRHDW
jgi:hypothetical protein